MQKLRQSNIELLRIISMLMVVAYHLNRNNITIDGISLIICDYISNWGIVGVNCFFIISAWFWCRDEKKLDIKKILPVISQVVLYSVLITIFYIIYQIIQGNNIEAIIQYLKMYFYFGIHEPLWIQRYWFVSMYVGIFFLHGYFNVLIRNLSREELKGLVIWGAVVTYIYVVKNSGFVVDVVYYSYIYILIAYLKDNTIDIIKKHAGGIFLIINVVTLSISIALFYLNASYYMKFILMLRERNSMLSLILAILLFNFFLKLDIKSKIINFISKHTFAVYLLHENKLFNLCDLAYLYGGIVLGKENLITYIIIVIFIFVMGIITDILRSSIINKFRG